MPPRHGKSLLCSRMFPAWYLGRHPDRQIITASYNSELATDFGRQVRNTIAGEEYQHIFPNVQLAQDSKSAGRWHTNHGGAYVAAGVGTAITGRGAHVALIDDPCKDRQEADSETIRNRTWDWYTSTLYTRLMPGGSIVLIQTRWHCDDLAGRLLAEQESRDKWVVLNLPAINDHGKALWPEWFPIERLESIRAAIGTRDWEALYQQCPSPGGGSVIRREWFRIIPRNDFPLRMDEVIQVWDTAFKEGTESDYSVCCTMGFQRGNIYILDIHKKRMAWPELLSTAQSLYRYHMPRLVLIEERASGISLIQALAGSTAMPVFPVKADVSKTTRTTAISGIVESGRVYLPDGFPWVTDFLDECSSFPMGAHDDQVDSFTHGVTYLMTRGGEQIQQQYYQPISISSDLDHVDFH